MAVLHIKALVNSDESLFPKVARPAGSKFFLVDGKLVHGDCNDCGGTVFVGESFLRVAEGLYVCTSCADVRCAACGGDELVPQDEAQEPICVACFMEKMNRADEQYVEMQFAFYTKVIHPPKVTVDLDEGRYLRNVSCISCHEVDGRLSSAEPVRSCNVEVLCNGCDEPLTPVFDQFTGRAL